MPEGDVAWDELVAENAEAVGLHKDLESRFCGVPDLDVAGLQPQAIATGGHPWVLRRLVWKVDGAGAPLAQSVLESSAAAVFAQWHTALPWFTFEMAPAAPDDQVNVLIRFAGGTGKGADLGAKGGTLARCEYPNRAGRVLAEFDTADTWTASRFERVLLHEFGHGLGLNHSTDVASVMFPSFRGAAALDAITTTAVRALYGWDELSDLDAHGICRPGLASDGTTAVALIAGGGREDQQLAFSVSRGSRFSGSTPIAGRGSSDVPALCPAGDGWFALWKGIHHDTHLWSSRLDAQGRWGDQHDTGWRSSSGPSLANASSALVAAWRGVDDQGIYWSWSGQLGELLSPAGSWVEPQAIPDIASSTGPALVHAGGVTHLFWQGMGGDTRVWHSHLDPATRRWAEQAVVQPIHQVEAGPVVTRGELRSISGVSACALPSGGIAVCAGSPTDGVTFAVQTSTGAWEWTTEFPTGFSSIGGQSVAVVAGRLLAVGRRSADRFDTTLVQRSMSL